MLRSAKDLKNFAILATDGGFRPAACRTEDLHLGCVDLSRDAINTSPTWPHWCRRFTPALGVMAALLLAACGDVTKLPAAADTDLSPTLPPPVSKLISTVHIAPAVGWTNGAMPTAAPGMQVAAYAKNLHHPRWLLAPPNGDVLVA